MSVGIAIQYSGMNNFINHIANLVRIAEGARAHNAHWLQQTQKVLVMARTVAVVGYSNTLDSHLESLVSILQESPSRNITPNILATFSAMTTNEVWVEVNASILVEFLMSTAQELSSAGDLPYEYLQTSFKILPLVPTPPDIQRIKRFLGKTLAIVDPTTLNFRGNVGYPLDHEVLSTHPSASALGGLDTNCFRLSGQVQFTGVVGSLDRTQYALMLHMFSHPYLYDTKEIDQIYRAAQSLEPDSHTDLGDRISTYYAVWQSIPYYLGLSRTTSGPSIRRESSFDISTVGQLFLSLAEPLVNFFPALAAPVLKEPVQVYLGFLESKAEPAAWIANTKKVLTDLTTRMVVSDQGGSSGRYRNNPVSEIEGDIPVASLVLLE
ncbi:hypothetical protein DFH09DRAFT_1097693 [Mycena vulgaris]|nr:hypothetical protein DFH09DRAFT_1097693 [Mycena vulgaris]